MPSRNLKTLLGLIDVSCELTDIITAQEDFNPDYKKNRDRFRRLIAERNKLERIMRRYFRGASERIFDQVDWFEYAQSLVRAQEFTKSIDWEDEELILTVTFNEALGSIYELGIEQMEESTGFVTGLSSKELSFQREIRQHSLDLAKGMTKTTKNRVRQVLKTSLAEHQPVEEAGRRLVSVVNDKTRANMIARTETVNAHAKGITTAGKEMGAKKKRWLVSLEPCPICGPIADVTVPINSTFPGGFDSPPAHPNCLCLVENVF